MPFGLSNSPAVFQALVNDVLRDMVDQFIYVYLDDILIFSSSLQEHVQHVRRVLQRLLENGLFVKAEKCDFHAQSVSFLGYIISSEGMCMDPDKVKAVMDWPSPDSRKALQRFLGFANFYRRFIRNFSQLAAPLTALTSPRTTFRWSDTAETVFANLKSRFSSAPILVTPDPTRQFVVEVDASEVGVGAVLSQRTSSDDKMHPCAFFSHRLSPAERNYDIGNRELLAVKLALEEWRHWLEGSGVPFIVWTDHKNLEYIRSAKRLNSRQARWALFFRTFWFYSLVPPGFQEHQTRRFISYFWSIRTPGYSRVHFTWESSYLHTHMGGRVEGQDSLRRGNASARLPTESFVCSGGVTVRRYSMGSLLQRGEATILVAINGSRYSRFCSGLLGLCR